MTTVLTIIDDAFRVTNTIATGGTATAAEKVEALRYLNRIVNSVMGNEVGENFVSMPIGDENISRPVGYPWYGTVPDDSNWFVPENHRLYLNINEPLTVYLHPDPDEGARLSVVDLGGNLSTNNLTINANGRHIQGSNTLVLSDDGVTDDWLYRSDVGDWIRYTSLALDDTFPLPEEFDDFFVIMLAMRLNPAYGQQLDGQSLELLRRARKQIRARYNTTIQEPVERGLLRMTRMTGDRQRQRTEHGLYNPNRAFDRGWPF